MDRSYELFTRENDIPSEEDLGEYDLDDWDNEETEDCEVIPTCKCGHSRGKHALSRDTECLSYIDKDGHFCKCKKFVKRKAKP